MAMESENTKRLAEATYKLSNLDPRLKVNVKGKSYAPVKERLRVFREHFGADASFISTVEFKDPIFFKDEIIFPGSVVARTELWIKKDLMTVGIAEELRNSSPVNKTSATENAMTSSLGICLARLGLEGGEFASADEMQTANRNGQAVDDSSKMLGATNKSDDLSPHNNREELVALINKQTQLGGLDFIYTQNQNDINNDKVLLEAFNNKEKQLQSNRPDVADSIDLPIRKEGFMSW